MGLTKYRQKRDFQVTSEPAGSRKGDERKGSRFVIQKHAATRLHYDFRLEMEGVLKSWAVPKGLPWTQAERHLAVEVEDHPLDYADFEGIIPAGQYGGGTVMVWDRGTYEVTHADSPLAGLRQGKFHVLLHGEKNQGEWAMIRIKSEGGKNQWLLMKTGGSIKPLSVKRDDESVKTGRSMKQIAAAADAEWHSNREDNSFRSRIARAATERRRKTARKDSRPELPSDVEKLPRAKPRFIEPMKPRLVTEPPNAGNWLYELKFDGIRAVVVKEAEKLQLISRNENTLNVRFPAIAEACAGLAAEQCVVDGEIVALDEKGRSSFQLLQRDALEANSAPLVFYVFDLLQWGGRNLLSLPLARRKELLAALLPRASDDVRLSDELADDPRALLAEVKRLGLEGLVGKQRDSAYEPGRRSGAWIKIKCLNEQEFVIGGYTPPAGSRQHFGALLVGYYSGAKLLFAGKVGTGFNTRSLASLFAQMRARARSSCPFADLPSKQGGQWVQGITPGQMRKCSWVEPELVAQVKFAEWTRDLKLRQPVYLGLREDKEPRKVVREI